MSIFSVEISRPGKFGLNTSAVLEMPATWAEFQDAKEKARITDDKVIYSYEVLHCEHDWLRPHIPENGNLLELNLLARRMEDYLKDSMDVFDAMVKLESGRSEGEPIPLPKLINLTFSTENCHVVGDIASDTQLGKFLFENDFFTESDAEAVRARIDAGSPIRDLFALLGKEHRITNGGVLTASGCYVEYDGSVNEVYVPGEMAYFDRSGAPVVLTVSKGHFNDPGYDNDRQITLNLPATDQQIIAAADAVGAASLKEIAYSCADCLIPAAKEWLDDTQDIEQVNDFAKTLHHMERHGGVTEYKALLEAAGCEDMDTALRLTDRIGDLQLNTECSGPEDYGREILHKPHQSENGPLDISPFVDHYRFGKALMEKNNTIETSYGLLSRTDCGPILSQADQPGMKMGGLGQ